MWRCVTKRDLMAGRFRSTIWDPVLIMSQIALVQSIFYSGVGLWLAMLDAMLDAPRSLQQVFRYELLEFSSTHGRVPMFAFTFNALTCAVGLWMFVRRGRQCLDFALTAHGFHLLACWGYNSHLPSAVSWWLVQLIAVTITAVLAEYLCMRSELRAIPLGLGRKADL
uniref:protein SYS1 homolog isoform X1 n=1 Tax=Myxine glutinosa TaxID=7769 RepID=UPI00358ECD8F